MSIDIDRIRAPQLGSEPRLDLESSRSFAAPRAVTIAPTVDRVASAGALATPALFIPSTPGLPLDALQAPVIPASVTGLADLRFQSHRLSDDQSWDAAARELIDHLRSVDWTWRRGQVFAITMDRWQDRNSAYLTDVTGPDRAATITAPLHGVTYVARINRNGQLERVGPRVRSSFNPNIHEDGRLAPCDPAGMPFLRPGVHAARFQRLSSLDIDGFAFNRARDVPAQRDTDGDGRIMDETRWTTADEIFMHDVSVSCGCGVTPDFDQLMENFTDAGLDIEAQSRLRLDDRREFPWLVIRRGGPGDGERFVDPRVTTLD